MRHCRKCGESFIGQRCPSLVCSGGESLRRMMEEEGKCESVAAGSPIPFRDEWPTLEATRAKLEQLRADIRDILRTDEDRRAWNNEAGLPERAWVRQLREAWERSK